jgi:SAM-dependent MidA family methyltransferase
MERLPECPIDGAVIANEVLDALPVARFVKRGGNARPLGVADAGPGFRLCEGPHDPALSRAVAELEAKLGRLLPEGYQSEICLLLPVWLKELAASLGRGSLVFVDYGFTRREYYHEQRSEGTLICHYRHRAHQDPFCYPGLTDLSAWVDFSACADAAAEAGLTVAGFTTQAQFLVETAAADPAAFASAVSDARERSALQTLILPGEMGESFKVLLLRKGTSGRPLPGRDQRHRL